MYRLLSHPVTFADVVAPCSTDLTAVTHVLFHEAAHPDRPVWRLLVDSALIQLSVVLLRSLSRYLLGRAAASISRPLARGRLAAPLIPGIVTFRTISPWTTSPPQLSSRRYHFLRCFKAQVGTTPYAYLLQVHLPYCCYLAALLLPINYRHCSGVWFYFL